MEYSLFHQVTKALPSQYIKSTKSKEKAKWTPKIKTVIILLKQLKEIDSTKRKNILIWLMLIFVSVIDYCAGVRFTLYCYNLPHLIDTWGC